MLGAKEPIAVVRGPKGTAQLYEVVGGLRKAAATFVVEKGDKVQTFATAHEAYIQAGEQVGSPT